MIIDGLEGYGINTPGVSLAHNRNAKKTKLRGLQVHWSLRQMWDKFLADCL